MNERIRELLNEATSGLEPDLSPQRTVTLNEMEKFAELIVKECVEVFSKDLPDPTSPDYQIGSLPEVVNRIANVAEHFGVEE